MKKVNYIDNEEMIRNLNTLKVDPDNEDSREYLGDAFLAIARGVSNLNNFKNYSYRKDMVSDAALNCWLYMENFDSDKSNNPFAYFTQIVWFSFIRFLEKEKRQVYIKYKLLRDSNNFLEFSDLQSGDDSQYSMVDNTFTDGYVLTVDKFIEEFESKMSIKKEKVRKQKKEKAAKNLESLME